MMKRTFAAVLFILVAAPANGQDYEMRELAHFERNGIKFYEHADKLAGIPSCLRAALYQLEPFGRFIDAHDILRMRWAFEDFLKHSSVLIPFAWGDPYGADPYEEAKRSGRNVFEALSRSRGGCFTAPDAVESGLAGLDSFLADIEASLRKRLWRSRDDLTEVGEDYRHRLEYRLKAIQQVRRVIGVPPLVTSEEELRAVVRERGLTPGDKVNWRGKVLPIQSLVPPSSQ